MANFLVLSDIHACDVDPSSSKAPSYVSSYGPQSVARIDPIDDLIRVVKDEGFSIDYVLCAGDITNKSHPASLTFAWEKLNKFSKDVGASLIATVGNHDIDSRYQANKFDPKGYAMSLSPNLPFHHRERFLEFWAENFTLLTFDRENIVVLNTAAYHGAGSEASIELEHGRISDVTLSTLRKAIESAPRKRTNILLCHHHPIKGDVGDSELRGVTRGGENLVTMLGEMDSQWIIIHGHKHTPDLFYGHGGSSAPIILSSASFSAQVNLDAQNKNPNQVHLLTADADLATKWSGGIAGRVKSWTWQPGVGWEKASGSRGLPYEAGFGYRSSVDGLAESIAGILNESGHAYVSWSDLVKSSPEFLCLVPSDFNQFRKALSRLGLNTLREDDGTIAQVGWKK